MGIQGGSTTIRRIARPRPQPAALACMALALVLTGTSPAPKPTLNPGDTLDSICGAELRAAEGARAAGTAPTEPSIKLSSCQAARDNQTAVDADQALYKVWAGVSAVCTGMCVATLTGHTVQYVCAASNAIGSATEAAYLKNYQGLIMGIAESGMSVAASKMLMKGKDLGSCLIAAHAAQQSYAHYADIKTQQQSFEQNLLAARDQSSQGGTAVAISAPGGGGDGQGGAVAGSQSQSLVTRDGPSATAAIAAACGGGSGSMVQCAIASDRTLPDNVRSGRLEKDFRSLSGFPLSELANKNLTPAQSIAGSMGSSLSQSQVATLANGIQNLNMTMGGDTPESMMAGGGGGGGNSGGATPSDDLSQIAGLMSQLMPGGGAKEEDPRTKGMRAVVFANQHRGPASVAEDKSLNLFDRVTVRYYAVSSRLGGKL